MRHICIGKVKKGWREKARGREERERERRGEREGEKVKEKNQLSEKEDSRTMS